MTKVTLTLKTIGLNGANEKIDIMMKMSEQQAVVFFKQSRDLLLRTMAGPLFHGDISQVEHIQYTEMPSSMEETLVSDGDMVGKEEPIESLNNK